MEINVHDIVKFSNLEKLEKVISFPEWLTKSATSKNYGVVRRMNSSNELIPIGLRGKTRDQRFGTFIHVEHILEVIPPTALVERIDDFRHQIYYEALSKIRNEFKKLNLLWGPTGSVGFEIATSTKVTSALSDIDLSIYLDKINHDLLNEVGKVIDKIDWRVDVQVEVPKIGAILLVDYLKNVQNGFIVRTPFGPQLCKVKHGMIRPIETSNLI